MAHDPNDVKSASFSSPTSKRKSKHEVESYFHSLTDKLTCQICCEMLAAPITLACGHSFCFCCVKKWMDENACPAPNHDHHAKCPLCRTPIKVKSNEIDKMQISSILQGFVEALIAFGMSFLVFFILFDLLTCTYVYIYVGCYETEDMTRYQTRLNNYEAIIARHRRQNMRTRLINIINTRGALMIPSTSESRRQQRHSSSTSAEIEE